MLQVSSTSTTSEMYDPDVQSMVILYNTCQAFSALPREGGVMDQDWYIMEGMMAVGAAMEAKRKAEQQMEEAKARAGRGPQHA